MLERSDKERLAILETSVPWIRDALGRVELSQKEIRKDYDEHLRHHRFNGNGGSGSKDGISIQVGGKALGIIATMVGTTWGGTVWAALGTPGIG